MALIEQHAQDLQQALEVFQTKNAIINNYWAYYEDLQPPVWLSTEMRDMFRNLNDRFSLNLCKLAVDVPLNRLWVESWGEESVKDVWQDLRLDREQKRLYKHALVAGEAYVIGWRRARDGRTLVGFNDPRTVHLFHSEDNPGEKTYAAKVWLGDDELLHAILYYPDQIVRMIGNPAGATARRIQGIDGQIRRTDQHGHVASATAGFFDYDPDDPGGPHTLGEVPVWRFSQDLWLPKSRLDDLIPIQDVINKLRANKMVASETGAFPQRVYLTTQDLDERELIAEPATALVLDPGDRESPTNVEEFGATPLKNYDDSIISEIQHFFTVAHLPRHLLVGQGHDRSGDAIRSDEGPFAEMVRDIAQNFGYSWTDLMNGLTGTWDAPEWQDARINNNEAQAREFKMLVEAQMPPAYAAMKAFQWSKEDALAAGLSDTIQEPDNLSDRSPAAPRTQTTEDST